MHVIDADFQRLSDITVPDIIGSIGVYVLWGGRARARPSYIGEGNILRRLVQHHDRFGGAFDGFAAILSDVLVSSQRAKSEATILEAMLLWVAEDTDRTPSTNVAPGKLRALEDILKRHDTVRINVSGLDPLRPPEEAPRISGRRSIVLRGDKGGAFTVEHDWRARRRRQ